MAKKTIAKKMTQRQTNVWLAQIVGTASALGWTFKGGKGYIDAYGSLWTRDGSGPAAIEFTHPHLLFEKQVGALHVKIALNLVPVRKGASKWDKEHAYKGMNVEGHTSYNGRSFTRVGIDCESCKLVDVAVYDHEYVDVQSLLEGEWLRCEVAFERSKTMVAVPGLPGGWKVTPERRAQIGKDLAAGKSVTFAPHGFGTGYRIFLAAKRTRFDHGVGLPAATNMFFGVTCPLCYETMDCD